MVVEFVLVAFVAAASNRLSSHGIGCGGSWAAPSLLLRPQPWERRSFPCPPPLTTFNFGFFFGYLLGVCGWLWMSAFSFWCWDLTNVSEWVFELVFWWLSLLPFSNQGTKTSSEIDSASEPFLNGGSSAEEYSVSATILPLDSLPCLGIISCLRIFQFFLSF